MNALKRRRFLQWAALTLLTRWSAAKGLGSLHSISTSNTPLPTPPTGPGPNFIIDLHCHPNLKNYLHEDKMWHDHPPEKGENLFNMQVDYRHLKKGNVKGILAAHYLPESGMRDQANLFRKWMPFLRVAAPLLVDKVEKGDARNFGQLTTMMDDFEAHIEKTNDKKGGIRIARSFADFETAIKSGQIAVAQTIEGSHALGRGLTLQQCINNLNFLADRGICMMGLSHFFANDNSYPVEGISPFEKKFLRLHWKYNPVHDDRPLTEAGLALARHMLHRGIIIDLTHMTPKGRAQVFALNENFKHQHGFYRPLVASHVGVQALHKNPAVADYHQLALTDEEIIQIRDCGGVIGIVAMNFWLVGNDRHLHKGPKKDFQKGIQYMVDTVKKIRCLTGSYNNIAIGSDFDGFADAPKDLRGPAEFPRLVDAIAKLPEIKAEDLLAITHGNALRILRTGWGSPVNPDCTDAA